MKNFALFVAMLSFGALMLAGCPEANKANNTTTPPANANNAANGANDATTPPAEGGNAPANDAATPPANGGNAPANGN